MDDDRPPPVHVDRARIVDGIYRILPQREQRVMQFEYPRYHELRSHTQDGKIEEACRRIGCSRSFYDKAIRRIKDKVREAFS